MPELAEVETVRRVLEKSLVGLTIVDIKIKYSNIIEGDAESFKQNVIGKKIESFHRRGKYLIFDLNEGKIISHLRMEGKFFYLPKDSLDNKHIHVIYYFNNGYMLAYQDVRKFGRMEYHAEDIYKSEPLNKLGCDPILDGDINYDLLYKRLIAKKIAVKTALLDQSIIAGLGNIYVDEVLFKAHVNPHRQSCDITFEEFKDIMDYSKEILAKAIECGGTTIRSYTSSLGVEGSYQNYLCVHTKEICPICGDKIIKDKTNGRGTYYCKNCQK